MPNFRKSKLISLLKKLSKAEITALKKDLKANGQKQNPALTLFFEEVCKYYPDFNNKELTSGHIFKKAYPDKIFNYGQFSKLRSAMTVRVKKYMAEQEAENTTGKIPDIHKTKLMGLLRQFSKEDFKNLLKFLQSPYLNKHKMLSKFLEAIFKYYPLFPEKNLSSEKIFKRLYPGEAFNYNKFRWLLNQLIGCIEDYLALEELKKEKALKSRLTLKGLSRIGKYQQFRIASESKIKALEAKGEAMGLSDYKSILETYHDLLIHPQTVQRNAFATAYTHAVMDNLDYFYFFSKVTYSLLLLSRVDNPKKHRILLLKRAISLGKKSKLHNNILFKLYTLAVELLQTGEAANYKRLKVALFDVNDTEIPREGKQICVAILSNFASGKQSAGNALYLKELFDLYEFRDRHHLFLSEDSISGNVFTNVVVGAAASEEFKWTRYFMKKYTPHIREGERNDAVNLSKAFLSFYQENYDRTLKQLAVVSEAVIFIKLRVRSLTIRALYEISVSDDSFEGLVKNKLQAFTTLLEGDIRIDKDRKDAYTNFADCCMDILKLKSKIKKLERNYKGRRSVMKAFLLKELQAGQEAIRRKMEKMKRLKFRIWLQDKVDGLEDWLRGKK